MKYTCARLLVAAFSLSCLFSCSWFHAVSDEESSSSVLVTGDPLRKRVAILPFVNNTGYENSEESIRKSFYGHFSPKNYYDFELSDVDGSLKTLEGMYGTTWNDIPATQIGRYFNADFLVYGEVKRLRKLYLVFYSQMNLSVKIRMVETRRGKIVWEGTMLKRLHSGDLPLHPLSFLPAAIRSGLSIDEQRKQDLIERTCKALAAIIPGPAKPLPTAFRVDVQVASFADKNNAGQMLAELRGRGFNPRIEQVSIKNAVWYRVILGPFINAEAEKTKQLFAADERFQPLLIHHSRAGKGLGGP